jgi:hypothetical protein
MKKSLSKAELDAAEAAFADYAYKNRAHIEKKVQETMAKMRAEAKRKKARVEAGKRHPAKSE